MMYTINQKNKNLIWPTSDPFCLIGSDMVLNIDLLFYFLAGGILLKSETWLAYNISNISPNGNIDLKTFPVKPALYIEYQSKFCVAVDKVVGKIKLNCNAENKM